VALLTEGATHDEIRAVFKKYPIGEKYREKGTSGDNYLIHSIAAAEDYIAKQQEDVSFNSFTSYGQIRKPRLAPEALYGLAGQFVQSIDPFTEADSVAVLINLLTAYGNLIGHGPHFKVEFTRHFMNLFAALVGATSKGRKGTSWSAVGRAFQIIDSSWSEKGITSGLSSGEGLINAVRDQRSAKQPIKQKGRVVAYQDVIVDQGVSDKRLLVIEGEFAQALKVMSREGNILSTVIRQAWDTGDLHPLTKNNPITATGAHISIIGHITREELLRHLDETEKANGFANRFIWLFVERSKIISNPKGVPWETLSQLMERLIKAVNFARTVEEITRDDMAESFWAEVYPDLSKGEKGLIGAVISRGEAQVMRLACLYALLDQSNIVRTEHLNAALALWQYAEKSARLIFGDRTGDRNVDKAKAWLKQQGNITLTELHNLFGRNLKKVDLDWIVSVLLGEGFATIDSVQDHEGRPTTILRSTN
jgi:Protein of unknown function (DUF3987)